MSKLYFTYSAMNAGKSALLLQAAYNYRERGLKVMLWTSSHHAYKEGDRTGQIVSRIGLSAEARLFSLATSLKDEITQEFQEKSLDAVFLDEAQFLTWTQVRDLADLCDRFRLPVLCYGLRTDFRGQLFEGAAELLAIADHLREARTICHCGRKASMTARLDEQGRAVMDGEQVSVGKQVYASFCRKHWMEVTGQTPS